MYKLIEENSQLHVCMIDILILLYTDTVLAISSLYVCMATLDWDRGKQYVCGPSSANDSRGEGNIGSLGSTKQSISILSYTKRQRKQKETKLSLYN